MILAFKIYCYVLSLFFLYSFILIVKEKPTDEAATNQHNIEKEVKNVPKSPIKPDPTLEKIPSVSNEVKEEPKVTEAEETKINEEKANEEAEIQRKEEDRVCL